MALVYTTTRHLPLGAGGALLPPGTVITDASSRSLGRLIDRGWVAVTDDSAGGGGGGEAAPDADAAADGQLVVTNSGDLVLLDRGTDYQFLRQTPGDPGITWDYLQEAAVIASAKPAVASSGAAQTIDASAYRYFEITLDDDCIFTVSNLSVGLTVVVYVKQDGTGGRALSIAGTVLTDEGADVLAGLSTAASAAHLLTLLQTNDGLAVLVSASSLA